MSITLTSVQCFGLVTLLVCCVVTSTAEEERKPTYLGAAIGSYVVLNCPLDFPQEIEIPYILLWNKDGEKVFSWYDGVLSAADDYAGRITFLDSGAEGYGRGSVNLTAIRETDGGWYQCRVIFPRRTPSSRNNGTWFHLNVDGGALLAIPPVNQTTMEGEKASFPCVTKEMDSFVTWLKDGTPISDLPDLNHRSVQDADGSLSINPTAMGDLGEYQCEVTNGKGDRQTAHAYLNVQYKAKVIYAPREVYLPYGRPAILDCHYRANPPLTNLRWDKDGFLFDPYNVQGVFYRRNGSLFFSKVDESHTGHYTCTPFNELGTEGASPIISVIVQRPPAFTVTPSSLYLRKLGESLEMPCDARDGDGDSRPTIVWIKKDGTPLPKGRYSVQGGNMTIENIQEEDRGLYQCSATNEAATIAAESELMVENATPRAPYNLTANATQNSITLRWAPGYVRPRLEYNIWYRPVDIAEWRTMRILSRRTTEATITNLSPGREYEFMVLSQDKYGDGMFSKALRVFTLPSEAVDADGFRTGLSGLPGFAQIGPPLNMCVEATSEGYVVTWDPPEYGRESLRLYVVRWSQGPQEFLYGSAETKDNYYIVKNLEEDETYTFQVYAMSTNDYQSASSKYVITVPPYRRIRAITIGVCAGLLILAAMVGAVLYARKKWCSLYKEEVDGSDSVKPNKGDS